jgi:16S rRNA C967 or C1407 C5-methylase (RsmB/RsmF family)/NOL1/NOP2/fmu family ribosome biogenesis protein
MAELLGPETDRFLAALVAPASGLRVNTLRLEPERFRSISPFELDPIAGIDEGFLTNPGERAGSHPYHAAGLYYLQDPGAMAVGAVAAPRPGERVLDLSAAPGGKTTHLAARMANRGLLVANDVSRPRALELLSNVERCGVTGCVVTNETPERLRRHFGAYFDCVLVDAPCSGESMFHKSEAAIEGWSAATVEGCARRQTSLLREAAELVAPGGRLVYSTCTFAREENEDVLAAFLDVSPDFRPEPLGPLPGAEVADLRGEGAGLAAAYRLYPHRFPGAGHFVGALRRVSGGGSGTAHGRRVAPSREALRTLDEFWGAVFPEPPEAERLQVRGAAIQCVPEECPSLDGLNVLRAGLDLGRLETRRFEPAHALALSGLAVSPDRRISLTPGDPRTDRYLAGHPIEAPGAGGWVVVAVDGFALGWGKRVGDTVKNHYPKGLRRRV